MIKFENDSCLIDTEYNIITCDEAYVCFVGDDKTSNMLDTVYPDDVEKFKASVEQCKSGEQIYLAYRIVSHAGRPSWVIALFESGAIDDQITIMIHLNDVTTVGMSNKDNFLNVLDKAAIVDYAQQLMEANKSFYMCIIDLDDFRNINDNYGHLFGDEVLVNVSRALKELIEGLGVVGRFGGDEMMLVLDGVSTYGELRIVMKNVRQGIEALYEEMGEKLKITVSIGVVRFPDNSRNYEDLFKIADNMLYRAKAKGKNRYIIYEPAIHGNVLKAAEVKHEHMNADGMSKDDMILEMLDLFVEKKTMSMKIALQVICDVFGLDEAALFTKGKLNESQFFWSVYDMPYASCAFADDEEDFGWRFDSYGSAVVNHTSELKEKSPKAYEYLTEQGVEAIVVYRFIFREQNCYLTFIRRSKTEGDWEEKDVTVLTLVGRMFELEQYNR